MLLLRLASLSGLWCATILLTAPAAHAISFSVSNLTSSHPQYVIDDNRVDNSIVSEIGATISFDLTVRNPSGVSPGALEFSVVGYDDDFILANDIWRFVGGSGVDTLFSSARVMDRSLGGVRNAQAVPQEALANPGDPFYVVRLASVFNADAAAGTGDGSLDVGWDGTVGGAHFRLTFATTGLRGFVPYLAVGVVAPGDVATSIAGDPIPVADAMILFVIPEPSTVVLVGLGLAALSSRARRDRWIRA